MAVEITTPVGRIVWGHPTKARDKINKDTKQKVLKADGTPAQQWSFGVAFDKATFQQFIWPAMVQEAATVYPPSATSNGQPSTPPKFSWKYTDGDGIDDQGKPYNTREGYAGCYVLAISSELMAPPIFKNNGASYQQLPGDAVKCGDYVAVGLNLKVNVPENRAHTPGLYVNPLAIEFVGYGTEIVGQGSADPNAIFKGAQHQLPPGASATPIGGAAGVGMPGMGMQQPGQPQPGMMGAPAQMMAPQPGAMAPAPMMQPGQPQPGMMPAPAPAMTAPAPVGPQRPTDPTHIAPHPQTGAEMWFINGAWIPAAHPTPAPDFVASAGMPAPAPMMAPAPMQQPGMMPAPASMMQPGMMPAPR